MDTPPVGALDGIREEIDAIDDAMLALLAKRFAAVNVPNTEENRRAYRDMLFTSKGLSQFISGVILYDETLRQKSANGTPFVELLAKNGILPGIKVDTGAKNLALCPGEKVTEGLDGLRERLAGGGPWESVLR